MFVERPMTWKRTLGIFVVLLLNSGCDPNPNGPSAPSAPPASTPGKSAPGDPKEKVPLRSVGQPIGMIPPESSRMPLC
jgi:hypothetical protein